ncbi:hypothetical protein B5P43_05680 [Bacillus sp. SRB_336]|jgi:hypothetical protein|nr:hypothetical protein B5P43_05680 [Bacillus sp. SRB_336]
MTNEHEQRIRELAHHIWESEGRPRGEEERHWLMAERLVEASELAQSATGNPRAAPKARSATKRTAASAATRSRRSAPKGKAS